MNERIVNHKEAENLYLIKLDDIHINYPKNLLAAITGFMEAELNYYKKNYEQYRYNEFLEFIFHKK